jgi:hypothetical protein
LASRREATNRDARLEGGRRRSATFVERQSDLEVLSKDAIHKLLEAR